MDAATDGKVTLTDKTSTTNIPSQPLMGVQSLLNNANANNDDKNGNANNVIMSISTPTASSGILASTVRPVQDTQSSQSTLPTTAEKISSSQALTGLTQTVITVSFIMTCPISQKLKVYGFYHRDILKIYLCDFYQTFTGITSTAATAGT
jgi:hypothetical protein